MEIIGMDWKLAIVVLAAIMILDCFLRELIKIDEKLEKNNEKLAIIIEYIEEQRATNNISKNINGSTLPSQGKRKKTKKWYPNLSANNNSTNVIDYNILKKSSESIINTEIEMDLSSQKIISESTINTEVKMESRQIIPSLNSCYPKRTNTSNIYKPPLGQKSQTNPPLNIYKSRLEQKSGVKPWHTK